MSEVSNVIDKEKLIRFPKVELHRHLEGTFTLDVLHKIAMKNNLPYPKDIKAFKREVQFPKESEPDFQKFLSKFKNDWYRSFDDIYDIVYHAVKAFKDDGLFYIELRFSPEHFAIYNKFDRKKVAELVIKAASQAAEEENIYIRYIITFNRGLQKEDEMIKLYEIIASLKDESVVGVDLAGNEVSFPPNLFTGFFDHIKKKNKHKITIHAGEVTGPEKIWDAIRLLHANRIGHGTSSIKDKKLQDFLIKEEIALEQCITSNYQTGSWPDERTHPLLALYKNNVPVTINSDDPFIQDTDLTDDYLKALNYFTFTVDDLVNLNKTAINASFLEDTEKKTLLSRYNDAVEKFKKEDL